MPARYAVLLVLGLAATHAAADPFAKGNTVAGKRLVDQHCIACHAARYGGDGSAIYTRADRRVKDAAGLLTQVRTCNTNLGLQWFDEDELNVASYLNKTYYKFEK